MEQTYITEAAIVTDLEAAHAQTCAISPAHSVWDCVYESEVINGMKVVWAEAYGYRMRNGVAVTR